MKLTLLFVFVSSFSLFGQIPSGTWSAVEVQASGTKRHESAFVNCDGVFYALGGRGKRPVDAYYPKQNRWEFVADAPFEFHHFQAISFHHEIYVMGAMTGNYPHEKPLGIKTYLLYSFYHSPFKSQTSVWYFLLNAIISFI